jgi:rhodanese-related sulfurtransferase
MSNNNESTTAPSNEEPRKAGVASPSQLKDFVSAAGSKLLIIDVRHPDATVEPGDVKSLAVAGFPSGAAFRPKAINLPWSRESKSMELPNEEVSLDTPIITHCGGGGRGQAAKEYLEKNGYTNVMNGGGPKETECWAEFGSL